MAVYSYRGVEYKFVNTQAELLEELKCPICLELVSDAVQTSCGHLFCGKCIKETETCPVDRKTFTCHKDNYNDRRVRNLKVKCPNKGRGCQWQGDLGGAARHTDENCKYQTVKCNNEGCNVKVQRGQLVAHSTNACPQRKYKCPHCGKEGTYLEVTTTHFTTCDDMPLPCPSGCGRRRLVRRNMAQHLSTECPDELVACTYAIAGCQEVVKRKDLQKHMQDKDQHIDTILSSYVSMSHLVRDVVYAVKCNKHENLQASSLPPPFCNWLQTTPTSYPRPPHVIKMEGFQGMKDSDKSWFSDPVYSHFGGYRMCLMMDANGFRTGKGTHVSVYIYLMRGDNDDNLKWPFKGTIKVSLLNQLEDGQHYTKQIWAPKNNVPEDTSGRVTGKERAARGWGSPEFISNQDLQTVGKNCQYLKDNTLFFRVDCFEPKLN